MTETIKSDQLSAISSQRNLQVAHVGHKLTADC